MITYDVTQGYPTFAVALFLITGGLLVWMDIQSYQTKNMVREKRWTQVLGWMNISLGILLFLINWVYLKFVW